MLFNSYIFIFLFFPLVILGYFGLNHLKMYRTALAFLTIMSFWFYGSHSIRYLLILILSMLINYGLVMLMDRLSQKTARLLCLWSGLLFNIGILFYFKYYDFFIDNLNTVTGGSLPLLRLALPLGISFYTFQQLSYVIDAYRKDCERYSLLEYAAYVSFFPWVSMGPIVHHSEMIPQFRDPVRKTICFSNMSKGLYGFSLGLAKKVLLADTFAKIVTIGYGDIGGLNTPSALLVMLCYSLQIYFDFSGYCDMAMGIGSMLNLELPINFNSPYKALSVTDFWSRWHMTLTRFFTRYIYIPLGGNRKGITRTCLNILIVFLISGIWHGANWTFIVWGLLHGTVMVCERYAKYLRSRSAADSSAASAAPAAKSADSEKRRLQHFTPVKWLFTFVFVTFAWSIFRAESLPQVWQLWTQLFTGGFGSIYAPITEAFGKLVEISFLYRLDFSGLMNAHTWLPVTVFTLLALLGCFCLKNTQEKTEAFAFNKGKILIVLVLMLWSIVSLSEISEFLYSNF
ncbi:MAG: MBOAT family protein [Lachnospiraceae bacterium]|nr:MBOAT family protein [Lachnospiraceae bacterium]